MSSTYLLCYEYTATCVLNKFIDKHFIIPLLGINKIINLHFNCKEEDCTSVSPFYIIVALPDDSCSYLAETCRSDCDEEMNIRSFIMYYAKDR